MSSRRILIATLNWGLGHSARCIPLIRGILDQNHEVFLASDGDAGFLLKEEFPELPYFTLPSYQIRYPVRNFWLHWSKKLPHLFTTFYREKEALKKILKETRADTIISDNRYGLFHQTTQNIFLTHQLTLPLNGPLKNPINRLLKKRVNHFDQCWIPDWDGDDNLSGQLSQGNLEIPKIFIGTLSRFTAGQYSPEIDLLVMLSGPEPLRTDLQKKLEKKLPRSLKTVVLMGKPTEIKSPSGSLRIFNHLPTAELNHLLNVSRIAVSRSGYSSIMDYFTLHKKAIMIPTPLQPEQIYLSNRHRNKPQFRALGADLMGLEESINALNAEVLPRLTTKPFQLPDW